MGEVNLPYEEQLRVLRRRRRRRRADACSSTSSACRTCTWRWPAQDAAPAREGAGPTGRRSRTTPSGPPSCATTTSSPSTSSRRTSGRRCSPPSARTRDMQLYGRGLRRRLPTMLGGDPRRIRMVYCLLFSLPGTPVLFYGEEIGMGENLDRRGPAGRPHARCSGRPGATAGSPRAPPRRLPGPVVERRVLARARQRRRPAPRPRLAARLHAAADPPLPRVPRARLGRRSPVLDQPHAAVLAHRSTWDDGSLVAAAQPGRRAAHRAAARWRTATRRDRLVDLLAGRQRARSTRAARPRSSSTATATAGCAWWPRTRTAWSSSPAAAGRRRARGPARAPARGRRACPPRPAAGAGRAGRRSRPGPPTSAAAADPTEPRPRGRPGA